MDRIDVLVPGHLAFASFARDEIELVRSSLEGLSVDLISSNLHREYFPLAADFGPVNLGVVYRFCSAFSSRLTKCNDRLIIYYFEDNDKDRSNACFLLGCLLMVHFGWDADEAAAPFTEPRAPFTVKGFRDATFNEPTHELSISSCLAGVSRATSLDWFNIKTFNAQRYNHLDMPSSGDIHELCPKFVAFKGPLAAGSAYRQAGEMAFVPEDYTAKLHDLGVTDVVRLNEADTYGADAFLRAGLSHHDLFFPDCAPPPPELAAQFLRLCDAAPGRLAVHCRAGLGRTGTLVAVWLMDRAGFTASEAMGWLRVVRPGSVIGDQQHFLLACQRRLDRAFPLLPPRDDARAPRGSEAEWETAAAAVTAGMLARASAKTRHASASDSASSSSSSLLAGSEPAGPPDAPPPSPPPSCAFVAAGTPLLSPPLGAAATVDYDAPPPSRSYRRADSDPAVGLPAPLVSRLPPAGAEEEGRD